MGYTINSIILAMKLNGIKFILITISKNLIIIVGSIILILVSINYIKEVIFEFNIRTYLASLTSLLIGLTLSSKLYYSIKKEINKVWISNTLTTMIVQLIEGIVFIFLMYVFELQISEIIFLIISRYIFRLFIGLLSNILQVKLSKLD